MIARDPEAAVEPDGWEEFLSDQDRAVIAASGFGGPTSLGNKPAVLVVDMTNGFCGDRPEPILESVKRYRTSCGAAAWEAVGVVNQICAAARAAEAPVIMTVGQERRADRRGRGMSSRKSGRDREDPPDFNRLVSGLETMPSDLVMPKSKPSAFHGTPLAGLLVEMGVDSLVVCGASTSGCVRATVVDAFSYNYPVLVPRDATVDRLEASYWVSLLDLDMRYATVTSSAEVLVAFASKD